MFVPNIGDIQWSDRIAFGCLKGQGQYSGSVMYDVRVFQYHPFRCVVVPVGSKVKNTNDTVRITKIDLVLYNEQKLFISFL